MIETLLIATSNPKKVEEIRSVFRELALRTPGGSAIEVLSLADLGQKIEEPEEDQPTFEGNAKLKASYYAAKTGIPCLADDSGLEVDALNGEPGVYSARYAGVDGEREVRDAANNNLLLANLSETPDAERTARFVCAMCVIDPNSQDDPVAEARGTFEGSIAREPIGANGFGYDPLFVVADESVRGMHAAELSSSQKNALSHRGKSTRIIAQKLAQIH